MSATEPVTPAPSTGGNKLQKWIQGHKPEAALGAGAAGIVAVAVIRRHSAGTDTSSSVPANATTAGQTAGGVSFDPAASDGSYDPMQSVLSLQTSLDALAAADSAALASLKSGQGKITTQIGTIKKQTTPKPKPKPKPKSTIGKQGPNPPRKPKPKPKPPRGK